MVWLVLDVWVFFLVAMGGVGMGCSGSLAAAYLCGLGWFLGSSAVGDWVGSNLCGLVGFGCELR